MEVLGLNFLELLLLKVNEKLEARDAIELNISSGCKQLMTA